LVNQQDGGRARQPQGAGETAAEAVRRGKARFLPSFAALKDLVGEACVAEEVWEAKVVAGIRTVLEYAASDPQGAYALTIAARRTSSGQVDLEQEAIAYFAGALRDVVAVEMRFAISTEEAIIESIAMVVRGHLQMGAAARLPERAPDLVYLALMPYLGTSDAERWASFPLPAKPSSGT
jgi:hypothetical protein